MNINGAKICKGKEMDFKRLNKESCVGSTNTKQKGERGHQDLNADSESTSNSIISLLMERESKTEHVDLSLPWLILATSFRFTIKLRLIVSSSSLTLFILIFPSGK